MIIIICISTHTPLARRDLNREIYAQGNANFYSHASCEARPLGMKESVDWLYISTHTPLARRDTPINYQAKNYPISTHTPLARRDFNRSGHIKP